MFVALEYFGGLALLSFLIAGVLFLRLRWLFNHGRRWEAVDLVSVVWFFVGVGVLGVVVLVLVFCVWLVAYM